MWYFKIPNGGQELYVGPSMRIGTRVMHKAGPNNIRAAARIEGHFPARVIRPPLRDSLWHRMEWGVGRTYALAISVDEAAHAHPQTRINWRCLLRRYPKMDPKFLALCKLC